MGASTTEPLLRGEGRVTIVAVPSRPRTLTTAGSIAFASALAATGCGALVGIAGYTLDDGAADASMDDVGAIPVADGGADCGANEKACGASCVSLDDPLYGCGTADCTPCQVRGLGKAVCRGRKCAVGCPSGVFDCNTQPSDGCETPQSGQNCATCGDNCGTGLCQSGACSDAGCTGGQAACNGACVDLQTSLAHCGKCGNPCISTGTTLASCSGGRCVYACAPGTFDCGEAGACDCRTGFVCLRGECCSAQQGACGAGSPPCCDPKATCAAGRCCRTSGFACSTGADCCSLSCMPTQLGGRCL